MIVFLLPSMENKICVLNRNISWRHKSITGKTPYHQIVSLQPLWHQPERHRVAKVSKHVCYCVWTCPRGRRLEDTQPGEHGTQTSCFRRLLEHLNAFGSLSTQFLSEGSVLLKVIPYLPLKHKSIGSLLNLLNNEIKAIVSGYGSLENVNRLLHPRRNGLSNAGGFAHALYSHLPL